MASVSGGAVRVVRPREALWLLPLELAAVAALTLGHRHVPLSATPFFVALGWLSLRVRGLRWRDVGLARPRSWPATLVIGAALGIALELLSTFVTEPTLARLTGTPPDLSDFRPLVGSVKLLALVLVANWVLAAFGEEMAFRGYLMNRLAGLGGGSRVAWVVSVLVSVVVFGACHEVQRLTGMIQAAVDGLLLAGVYFAAGRRLALPILAHGMSNTLAFVLIFFGRYPGL